MKNELLDLKNNKEIIYKIFKPESQRQADMITAIISLVKPGDDMDTEYQISYEQINQIVSPEIPYSEIIDEDISKVAKEIMNSFFKIKTDYIVTYYHCIRNVINDKELKIISFKIDNEVQQFYRKLKELLEISEKMRIEAKEAE